MSLAIGAQGTLFKIGNGASTEVFTTIPECTKVVAPNVKFDLLEVTSHDSLGGFKEYLPGLADGENATADFWFVPQNTMHQGLRTDSYAKTKRNFNMVFPGGSTGATIAFTAYIVNLNPQADAGAVLKNAITAKVTGMPVWT